MSKAENEIHTKYGINKIKSLKNLYEVCKYLHESGFVYEHTGVWAKGEKRFYEYTNTYVIGTNKRQLALSSATNSISLNSLIQFEMMAEEFASFNEISWNLGENQISILYHQDKFMLDPFKYSPLNYLDYVGSSSKSKYPSILNITLVFVDRQNKNKLRFSNVIASKNGDKYQVSNFPEGYEPNTNLLFLPEEVGPIEGLR